MIHDSSKLNRQNEFIHPFRGNLAFTLIELLVVIAIIGILSGIIIVTMSNSTNSATLAKSQAFDSSVRNALMMSMVGEWKLDEASGTAASDTWTNVNNGTLYNFTSTAAGYGDSNSDGWMSASNCVSKTCLKFDGSNDYIDAGGNSALAITGAITISVWVKFISFGTAAIIGRGYTLTGSGNYGYFISRYNNKIVFDTCSTSARTELPSVLSINDTNWHFVVATWDGTTGTNAEKIYIDGKLDAQGTLTFTAMGTPSYNFRMGIDGGGQYPFNGVIDDARVYNVVVPAFQIRENYLAGLNQLLAKGGITQSEYDQRIVKLNQNIAQE